MEHPPFSSSFTDKSRHMAASRAVYLKIFAGGSFLLILCIFAVFSIYWGALWKTPAHNLSGFVVDFDQSTIGSAVSQALLASSTQTKITWTLLPPSDFSNGPSDVADQIVNEKAWVAVVINSNATAHLSQAASSADSAYNGSLAITVYAVEARNENAFRAIIRPTVQQLLLAVCEEFAIQFAKQTALQPSIGQLLTNAPQVITGPLSFIIQNLRPFDMPVASAVTFVGLIYLLILSFFIVMIGVSAREVSGLDKHLTTGSLIRVRIMSTTIAYLVVSLFYSLLTLAFQVDFSRMYGRAGFVIFWMLNFTGMLAVGLALESMLTLLTIKKIPFFMILWIISNTSVCFMPIEVLPSIYKYGYAMPFYNVSRAVRSILFGTKNTLGLDFGVLIAWAAISCITLPLIQSVMRKKHIREINLDVDKEVED